jgi:hypothetical protein
MAEKWGLTVPRHGSSAAVALATSLNAKECVIHTDVDGVCGFDPGSIPECVFNSPSYDPIFGAIGGDGEPIELFILSNDILDTEA